MGAVLESYAVNAMDAHYYFREGKKEIDIIAENKFLLPIEVEETAEGNLARFSQALEHINSAKGAVVSSNQRIKRENIEVIPAYLAEALV
jgi:predicted AAA+ superfamily ATPase